MQKLFVFTLLFILTGWVQTGKTQMLVKDTGGSVLMVVTDKGYAGIGTSTPAKRLHVNGAIQCDTLLTTKTPAVSGGNSVLVLDAGNIVGRRNLPADVWDGDDDTVTQLEVNGDGANLTGLVNFVNGSGISITRSSQDITISATGGGMDTDWTIDPSNVIYRAPGTPNVGIWTRTPRALLHIYDTDSPYNVQFGMNNPFPPYNFESGLYTQVANMPILPVRYAQGIHSTMISPPQDLPNMTFSAVNGQLTGGFDTPLLLAEGYNARHDAFNRFPESEPPAITNSIHGLFGHLDLANTMMEPLNPQTTFGGAVVGRVSYDTDLHETMGIHNYEYFGGYFYGPKTWVSRNLVVGGSTIPAPDPNNLPNGTTYLTVSHIPANQNLPYMIWDPATGGVYIDSNPPGGGSDSDWQWDTAGGPIYRAPGSAKVGIWTANPEALLHIVDSNTPYSRPYMPVSPYSSGLLTEVLQPHMGGSPQYIQSHHAAMVSPDPADPSLLGLTYSAVNGQLTSMANMEEYPNYLYAEGYNARHDNYSPPFSMMIMQEPPPPMPPEPVNAIYGHYGHTYLDVILGPDGYPVNNKFTAAVLGWAEYTQYRDYHLYNHYAGYFHGPKTFVSNNLVVGTPIPAPGTSPMGTTNLTVWSLSPDPGQTVPLMYDFATGGVYMSVSSEKYKNDIQPLDVNVERLLDAEPKSFRYKDSGNRGIGFIAEELDALGLSDLVTYRDREPQAVNYELVSVYLLELVKHQRNDYQALLERVENLERGR